MWGYCEIITLDEKYYYGYTKNGKKDGFGIYYCTTPRTKVYIGFWENNKQNGIGKLMSDRSSKFCFWSKGEKLMVYENNEEAFKELGTEQVDYIDFFSLEIKDIIKKVNEIKSVSGISKGEKKLNLNSLNFQY